MDGEHSKYRLILFVLLTLPGFVVDTRVKEAMMRSSSELTPSLNLATTSDTTTLRQLIVVETTLLQRVHGTDAEQFGVRSQRRLVRGNQIRFHRIVVAQLNGGLMWKDKSGWLKIRNQFVRLPLFGHSPGSDCRWSAGGSANSEPAQSTAMSCRPCSRAA